MSLARSFYGRFVIAYDANVSFDPERRFSMLDRHRYGYDSCSWNIITRLIPIQTEVYVDGADVVSLAKAL